MSSMLSRWPTRLAAQFRRATGLVGCGAYSSASSSYTLVEALTMTRHRLQIASSRGGGVGLSGAVSTEIHPPPGRHRLAGVLVLDNLAVLIEHDPLGDVVRNDGLYHRPHSDAQL